MATHIRIFTLLILISSAVGTVPPARAMQFGVGLEYLQTYSDIKYDLLGGLEIGKGSRNLGLVGSVTAGSARARAEANLELIPDYIGSGSILIQPGIHGILGLGPMYIAVGTGIGYWAQDGASVSPYFSLRLGGELNVSSAVVDIFVAYRYQTTSGEKAPRAWDGGDQVLETFLIGTQVKFGD